MVRFTYVKVKVSLVGVALRSDAADVDGCAAGGA
jgi:hypothetical protein